MTGLIAGEFRKLLTTRLWLWLLLGAMGLTALYASLLIGFSEDPDTMTAPLNSPEGQRTLFAVAAGGANTLIAVLAAIRVLAPPAATAKSVRCPSGLLSGAVIVSGSSENPISRLAYSAVSPIAPRSSHSHSRVVSSLRNSPAINPVTPAHARFRARWSARRTPARGRRGLG